MRPRRRVEPTRPTIPHSRINEDIRVSKVRLVDEKGGQLGVKPIRSLEDDLQLQTGLMSYGGNGTVVSAQPVRKEERAAAPSANCHGGCACQRKAGHHKAPAAAEQPPSQNCTPDFSKMTPAQKIAYHKARWDRVLG